MVVQSSIDFRIHSKSRNESAVFNRIHIQCNYIIAHAPMPTLSKFYIKCQGVLLIRRNILSSDDVLSSSSMRVISFNVCVSLLLTIRIKRKSHADFNERPVG